MYYSERFTFNVSEMICFKILLLLRVINFVETGRRLIGFNFKTVSPTGPQQCLKLCTGHADCLSVNFSRNRLQCELNSQHETDTVQVTENIAETEDFIYISKTSFPNELTPQQGEGGNLTCPRGQMRVSHSTNKSSCFISRCVEATPPPYIGYSANISVDVSSYTGNNTPGNVGESRNFTCPQGTVAFGKETITCLANGQWETPRCQVCIESTDPKGENYWGSKNMTYTGKTCQRWDSQTPHSHSYQNNPENYCRNPSNHNGTWCYTMDPDSRWEDCDIPKC